MDPNLLILLELLAVGGFVIAFILWDRRSLERARRRRTSSRSVADKSADESRKER